MPLNNVSAIEFATALWRVDYLSVVSGLLLQENNYRPLRKPVPPTRSDSVDSITAEYSQHFKPIMRYPRTPPGPVDRCRGHPEAIKVMPGRGTAKKLDFMSPTSQSSSGSSGSSRLARSE